jgi:exonuclease III
VSNLSSLHHKLKLYSITKLKTDIILLSDTRVNDKNKVTMSHLSKTFLTNPNAQYDYFSNSTHSSRGVGILILKNADFSVERELRDGNCNILGLIINHKGEKILIVAVYGPNNYCEEFFSDLENILESCKTIPVLIGGDWNMTPSAAPVGTNIDVLNMQKLPNERHTRLLLKLQLKYSLIDPFRVLHPNKIEFSYIPRDLAKKNRSRIDFFLVSRNWIPVTNECFIAEALQCKLFDHKAIVFSTKKKNNKPGPIDCITKSIVNSPLTEFIVELALYESYLQNMRFSRPYTEQFKNNCLIIIGRNKLKIREISPLIFSQLGPEDYNHPQVSQVIAEIRADLADLGSLGIEDCQLDVENDLFLEILINNIRNDVLSFQRFVSKKRCEQTKNALVHLSDLKLNYAQNVEEIQSLEKKINDFQDQIMLNKIEKFRHYELINCEKITPEFVKLTKNANSDYAISEICDDNGTAFENDDL